jgi:fructokinase
MNENLMKTSLVPMDGFHLDNKILERKNLFDRKGAPETFDVKGFIELIKKLRYKRNSSVPLFDRTLDEVVNNARKISSEQEYLVIEGNYLLLNKDLWRDLDDYWDYKVFLSVDKSLLKSRLIERWLGENHTYSEAETRVIKNDLVNADVVNSNRLEATLELQTG